MKQASQIHAFTDLRRFSEMRANIDGKSNAVAGEVAKEFEALFIEMMLSTARKASVQGGLFDSHALELYQEMFDTQAARILAEQGTIGFGESIGRFLEQVSGEQAASTETAPRDLQIPTRRDDLQPRDVVSPNLQESNRFSGWTREALFPALKAERAAPVISHVEQRQQAFIDRVWPHAEKAAAQLGTSPSVLVAQAALETGWGGHIIPGSKGDSSNNLFGIKADKSWQGGRADVRTFEFLGGRPIKTKASFRTYNDISESFADYVSFVSDNPRYQRALDKAENPDAYIRELARAGYATDPRYAEKIISIRQRIEQPAAVSMGQAQAEQLDVTDSHSAAGAAKNVGMN